MQILIVCTGNTCRSPMGAGLFAQIIEEVGGATVAAGIRISSAGTAAIDGQPAAREAQEVCREVGCDLSAHRSRRLTRSMLGQSDLVLVMEEHHRQAVELLTPELEGKVMLLGEMAGQNPGAPVADPIGEPLERYREVREQLAHLLQAVRRRIEEDGWGGPGLQA
ncbi:MAG: low molecular weight protein arginine phosphatase [Candidatus Eisenbacteria sp.]|nr:low molecular weight protein arginine phosphatase [Candidatus Eisenbacteria bacterium]